jgi:hypothetical protein
VTNPSIEFVDTGRAKWLLCWTGALFAFSVYRALRGHPTDWILWALFGAMAASSISTIAHGTRWQKPMILVSYAFMAAMSVGIVYGLHAMG